MSSPEQPERPASNGGKPAAAKRPAGRGRLVAARTLVVLAVILAFPAALAGYVRWQAFDTPTFQSTARQMIADPTIRDQVAATLVDQLYTNVDVNKALEQRLPPDQQRLAAPLAAFSRLAADRLAPELLARPRAQQAFVGAATLSQGALLRLLEDRSRAIKTEGGDVYIDFRPLLTLLGDRVAIVSNVTAQLPPDAGRVRIMKGSQLRTAQDLTSLLRKVGSWFWLLPVGLAAAGVALARGRRRIELRAVAIGSIIVGLGILAVRDRAGNYLVNSLVQDTSVRPAAHNAWTILTNLLADAGWTMLGIGLVALFGVWLAGDTGSGRATRRAFAPVIGRRVYAFGITAFLFLLLIWWNPTAQTSRVPQMLAVAIVLAISVEALGRQTRHDFPLESTVTPGAALHSQLGRFRGEGGDGRSRELERLASLHDSGALTDAEFADEKARLLART